MILKASQRAGGNQLAAHLLNDRDNEHVTVHQLRGFVADDLHGAFQEAHAISRGTKCKQYLFSLSLNPPKGEVVGEEDFERAADEAERRLGLTGQPRAIVIHEKEGRRHAHVVWSRIDADEMRAVNLPHFKRKLYDLARELFLEHEWPLPEGLRTLGGKSPLNFTLNEWQQAKRLGRDPREIKDAIRDCWNRSDGVKALGNALEERGYFLAQGDRRGFVVVDTDGEIVSLARYAGLKTRDVRDKLGDPDSLPTVADVKARLRRDIGERTKTHLGEFRARQSHELTTVKTDIARLTAAHRHERTVLQTKQAERWQRETQERAQRFRRGLAGLWDRVTGKAAALRKANEAEAITALARDRAERDALAKAQMRERLPLQDRLDALRARHAQERKIIMRDALRHWRALRPERPATDAGHAHSERPRARRRGPSLDL